MNNKERLIKMIDNCIKEGNNLVIEIYNPNHPKPEVIINAWENLEYKREYYINAYNDNLEHNNDNNIKIVDFYIEEFYIKIRDYEIKYDKLIEEKIEYKYNK